MSHLLQLFVYKPENIIISVDNNFPILRFDTNVLACDFIRKLKSQPTCSLKEPYFIVNNMQLLPNDVRKLHRYKKNIVPERDDGFENEKNFMICDGCFSIFDNLDLLMMCKIDNNTNKDVGFIEYLEFMYNESQPDEEDLREMYNEQKKYNREDSD